MHLAWETVHDAKDIRVKSKQYENEVERLKNRLVHRENIEAELLARIHSLEEAVAYWKAQCEGVYINWKIMLCYRRDPVYRKKFEEPTADEGLEIIVV